MADFNMEGVVGGIFLVIRVLAINLDRVIAKNP